LEGTSGDFLALPGTHVVIEADGAGLRSPRAFLGEQPVSAELVDGRLRVVFETTRAVWWQVETPRPLGEPLRTRRFRIEVLPDRPPVIEVSGGVAQIELSPGDGLPLSIRASDDFGLRTVSRVVSADAGEWSRTVLSEPGAAAAELDDRFVAPDPGPPDGVFELRYEACDNDAVSGSKCTASRPIRVTMPTVAGRHQRTLANKEALLDRALDWLSDLVLTVAAGAPTDRDATIADHERHISLRAPWVQAAAALIEAQAADRLESGRNQAGIATLVDNVERRWKAVDDALDEGARRWKQPRLAPVHGRHIGEARSGLRDELERAVLDLAAFVDLQRGDELVGDLAEASQASAEMKDLLRQVADGKPLAAELKAALDKLRARLRDVARELAQRRGGPDDSFVNQMPSQLGEDTLAEIERAIAEGRIDDAMRLMEEADRALAQLGDQLATESASFAGGSGSAQRDRELQAAIEQTKRLEERQQQVAEEVGRLAEQQGTGRRMKRCSPRRPDCGKQRAASLIDPVRAPPCPAASSSNPPRLSTGSSQRWRSTTSATRRPKPTTPAS
jgi:hypothetical protein